MIDIGTEEEKKPDDLTGMEPLAAKDYILQFITTLKLTEKQSEELESEERKWESRVSLASEKNEEALQKEARNELERVKAKRLTLKEEIAELGTQIENMRSQLPFLAARQRSIDPDLLEQELLIALGHMPGDEKIAATDREFSKLEKEKSAQDALEELKARMKKP
ncbi:PspA/IM30 family protein [Leadbettera azotonutricia]|uniref:Putative chromosome partition protein n=1 Tax=Leadbettera azotonutricia (strain ATCC BAA-888 / DSM 13862 / ZAS-9) TaxID=545695 RepID=F5YEK6_LEAAZ|nr:chromosome partitioning protein [Leadbettera azotonutricia]AEF81078.1 putative chromosome partition protein [Leadbettera azotonutricia ZAS-9]